MMDVILKCTDFAVDVLLIATAIMAITEILKLRQNTVDRCMKFAEIMRDRTERIMQMLVDAQTSRFEVDYTRCTRLDDGRILVKFCRRGNEDSDTVFIREIVLNGKDALIRDLERLDAAEQKHTIN